jgi:serine/threonine protein kinase
VCSRQAADGLCVQRLGECLGKGAFGSVYKALIWGTGEAVAIKQIKLADLPKSELRMIEVWSLRGAHMSREIRA